jgi:hypothetical protein
LGSIVGILALASLGGQLVKLFTGRPNLYGLIPLFNLDAESNLPTFYSSLLLLFAALLLALIGVLKSRLKEPCALHWWILALGFLYLAIDEAAKLHELMSRPTTTLLGGGTNGIFYRTWVLPAGALVILAGLFFLRFWLRLPGKTRFLFALAAVTYVGAAAGLEVLAGHYAERNGFDTLVYIGLATLEETLEMVAIVVFIHALLQYIETQYGQIRLCLVPLPPQDRKV